MQTNIYSIIPNEWYCNFAKLSGFATRAKSILHFSIMEQAIDEEVQVMDTSVLGY